MTPAILLVIVVLVAAMLMFSIDVLPAEVVALGILPRRHITRQLSPQPFPGFVPDPPR